nr:hypothetical protein [Paraburkholderia nodosa]
MHRDSHFGGDADARGDFVAERQCSQQREAALVAGAREQCWNYVDGRVAARELIALVEFEGRACQPAEERGLARCGVPAATEHESAPAGGATGDQRRNIAFLHPCRDDADAVEQD